MDYFDDSIDEKILEAYERSKPSYKRLNTFLLERFPQLKGVFEEHASWQDGIETGSCIIFDDIVSPFTYRNLHDKKLVQEIFDFMEELLVRSDEFHAGWSAVDICFFENLVYNYDPRVFFEFVKKGTESYKLFHTHVNQKLGIK